MPNDSKNNQPELRTEAISPPLADELNEIALRCAGRPVVSDLSDADILGYDEFGVPAR